MGDFQARVKVTIEGLELIDQIEKKVNALHSTPIKLKLDIDKSQFGDINTDIQKGLATNTGFVKMGQNASVLFSKGFNSKKFKPNMEFAEGQKEIFDENKKAAKSLRKNLKVTRSEANKIVTAQRRVEAKIESDAAKEHTKQLAAQAKQFEAQQKHQAVIKRKYDNDDYKAESAKMHNALNPYKNVKTENARKAVESLKDYDDANEKLSRHFNKSDSFSLDSESYTKTVLAIENSAKRHQNAMKLISADSTKSVLEEDRAFKKAQESIKAKIDNNDYKAESAKMHESLKPFKDQDTENVKNAIQSVEDYDNAKEKLNRHFDKQDSFLLNSSDFNKTSQDIEHAAKSHRNAMKLIDTDATKKIIDQQQAFEKYESSIKKKFENNDYKAKSAEMQSAISSAKQKDSPWLEEAKNNLLNYNQAKDDLTKHFDPNESFKLNATDFKASTEIMENAAKSHSNAIKLVNNDFNQSLADQAKAVQSLSPEDYVKDKLKKFGNAGKDNFSRLSEMSIDDMDKELLSQQKNIQRHKDNIQQLIDTQEALPGSQKLDREVHKLAVATNREGMLKDAIAENHAQKKALQESQDKAIADNVNSLEKSSEATSQALKISDEPLKQNVQAVKDNVSDIKNVQMDSAKDMESYMTDTFDTTKLSQSVKDNLDNDTFSAVSAKMKSQLDSFAGQDNDWLKTATDWFEKYGEAVDKFKKHFDSNDSFKMDSSEFESNSAAMENAAKGYQNAMQIVNSETTKSISANQALADGNEVISYCEKNTKALKKYGEALKGVQEARMNATNQGERNAATADFKALKSSITAEGLTGNSFMTEVGRGFKQISQFVGVYGILQKGKDVAKQMVNSVREVDTAMTDLRKVSEAPEADIQNYFSQAAQTAKEYGATITDVISATADWNKMEYSLPDSAELARVSTLYKNVGDNMSIESASSSLISTLKGFDYAASDAESIVDKFNEVSNNFSIGSDGLGEALKRSASTLSAGGNTLDESIGLITAANSVVQDESVVGTAFKTISMRIRNTSTDLKNASLDSDGMVESTAKLREQMIALSGVDIMQNDNTFKSTYSILEGLAEKWQDLSDTQRASVTDLIAGKNQGQVMSALMKNWDIADAAKNASINSKGSAAEEQSKYVQSIQYSMDRAKASFEELSHATMSSDFLKGFVDAGNGAINVVTQLVDKIGILGVAGAGVGLFQGAKGRGKIHCCMENVPLLYSDVQLRSMA